MKRKEITIAIIAIAVIVSAIAISGGVAGLGAEQPKERVKVATTTSLYDTGLWEHLEPIFEEQYGVELHIVYAGTGMALELGKNGDVDAVVIHDKAREEQFVAEGYGVKRVPFAYNYCLIVGPPGDPAGIQGLTAEEAFKKLREHGMKNPGQVKFVSRGDESGTHTKEKVIWQAAGFEYETIREARGWYVESGRGMGPTLLMASQMNAYTLTDVGTFLTYEGKLNLVPIVKRGQALLNVYSVIVVSREKHPNVRIEMANNLVDFLTSTKIQELIGAYGVRDYGMPLFTPCAGA